MPKTDGNSPKEVKLKRNVIAGMGKTEAALDAGYSPKTAKQIAHNILKKPHIANEIKRAGEAAAKKAGVDAFWIAQRRKDIVERSFQSRPVLNKFGQPVLMEKSIIDEDTGEEVSVEMVPAYTYDSSGANKALDSLAKMVGCDVRDDDESEARTTPVHLNITLNRGESATVKQ